MQLNINRNVDTSKAFSTDSGKELKDFIIYCANAFSQLISGLRNGLTFADNFRCYKLPVQVTHNVAQVINTSGKTPTDVLISRSPYANPVTSIGWQISSDSKLQIIVKFDGSPASAQSITLLVFY